MKKQKKSFKSIIFTTITILIVTNLLLSIHYLISLTKHQHGDAYFCWFGYVYWPKYNSDHKICNINIRELQNSIEEYNYNNQIKMTELNTEKLLESGYIKSIPRTRDPNCKYISKGDLTDNGEICCELHGSESEITKNYFKEKREFDRKTTIYVVSIRILPALLYFIYALISLAI